MLRALYDRQQAHDALLRLDDAAFPLGKFYAERLGEAAHDVEDERESLGFSGGGARVVVILVGRLLVLVVCVARRLAIRALERPEEERREPRVLLDGPRGTVARFAIRGAQHLGESTPPHDLPDLLQVLGECNLAPFGGLDLRVAAEDLERRSNACEDEVCAADPFTLEALHPVANPVRQLAQDVGPVAYCCFVGARAADEVDAGGQRRGIAGAQARAHLGRNRPRSGDGPATANHAGEERLPPLGRLVGEDNRAHAIRAQHSAAFRECRRHSIFEELLVLVRVTLRVPVGHLAELRPLRGQRVLRIEWIAQELITGQRALQPDEEEVGEISVWNREVIRWIGKPDFGSFVG